MPYLMIGFKNENNRIRTELTNIKTFASGPVTVNR